MIFFLIFNISALTLSALEGRLPNVMAICEKVPKGWPLLPQINKTYITLAGFKYTLHSAAGKCADNYANRESVNEFQK